MISQINLKNFKCFKEQKIEFRPLTFLAGGNGVGKSSVVQALLLIKRTFEVFEQNKKEVELNGPYNLQLGRASRVKSEHPISDNIEFDITMEHGSAHLEYQFDEAIAPLSLQITSYLEKHFFDGEFRYLSAERIGPRKFLEMDSTMDLDVGYQGEYTNHVLYQADQLIWGKKVDKILAEQAKTSRFSAIAETWLKTIIPDVNFKVAPLIEADLVSLQYKNSKEGIEYYPPTATGFGITYVLPIIVSGLLASMKANSIFIVENPEAHLHPLGQSRIGAFLAILACSGVQVIVETHSEHVVNGARLQLALMKETDDLLINFFCKDQDELKVTPIHANNNGELLKWPRGFLDQEQKDLRELLRLRRNR